MICLGKTIGKGGVAPPIHEKESAMNKSLAIVVITAVGLGGCGIGGGTQHTQHYYATHKSAMLRTVHKCSKMTNMGRVQEHNCGAAGNVYSADQQRKIAQNTLKALGQG